VSGAGALAGARIAVDGRYARRPGMGIHRYLVQVVRLLREQEADVTLLANFPAAEAADEGLEGVALRSFGSRVNLRWEQWDLPRHLRGAGYDLYWAPANSGIPFLPVGGTPRLFTLHDLIPLRMPRMYLTRSVRYTVPYLVWTAAALARSDAIVTDSQASARDLRRTCGRRAVVAPPIWFRDLLPPAPAGGPPPALPEPLRGRRYVLYNGGLDPRKNVDNLIRGFAAAADADPDLHLALMGAGYEALRPRLAERGVASRTILTGFVSEHDKLAILRGASALVYPSLYEGFGLPLFEAFSQGVPVVASGNSSLGEVAGGAALVIDPRDPASIADGILRAQDPEVAARLRDLGLARWAAHDPEAVAGQVIRLVAAMTGRPTPAGGSPRAGGAGGGAVGDVGAGDAGGGADGHDERAGDRERVGEAVGQRGDA
jgi:glycosyltransferase involved in cell wall biosynthesis